MTFDSIKSETEEDFVKNSVALLAGKITDAISAKGECIIGLSGGSTPVPVYEELGKRTDIDWSKVFVFLIDDRFIEPTHDDSNQKLVRDSLLASANIPEENLLFPDTTLALDACVATYIMGLIKLFSETPPDVLVLGMGEDGHIASLFPPVPEHAFGEELVLHTETDRFAVHDRITVSPLVIMAAQSSILLLKGKEKIKVFDACVSSETADPVRWPLHISLATGKLTAVLCQ